MRHVNKYLYRCICIFSYAVNVRNYNKISNELICKDERTLLTNAYLLYKCLQIKPSLKLSNQIKKE